MTDPFMTRRSLMAPDWMWDQMEERAAEATSKHGKTVTRSQLVRQACLEYLTRSRSAVAAYPQPPALARYSVRREQRRLARQDVHRALWWLWYRKDSPTRLRLLEEKRVQDEEQGLRLVAADAEAEAIGEARSSLEVVLAGLGDAELDELARRLG